MAAGGVLRRAVHGARHPVALHPGLARGARPRCRRDRTRARGADDRAHRRHPARHPHRRPARRGARHTRVRSGGRGRRLCAGRTGERRDRDPARAGVRIAVLHAADAARRRLCAARPGAARPQLRSGPAVGLGRLHRRQFRRRPRAGVDRARQPDLAAGRRDAAGGGGGRHAGADVHGRGCVARPQGIRRRTCCAVRRSCWSRCRQA